MAFEELQDSFLEAESSAKSYLKSSREYYKLRGFKVLMKAVLLFVKIASVGVMFVLALLFLSISAAFWIGSATGSTAQGFLWVGLFYIILGVIIYVLRHKLNKPLLQKFSEFYFDEI